MHWFKHDTDATQDAKVKKLLIKHGAIGYAVYFHCLELIASDISETNMTFELEHDSELIADTLRIKGTSDKSGTEIVEDIMRYIIHLGLFMCSNNHIFCFKLLHRLETSMTSSDKFRKLITEAKKSHDNVIESHDRIMIRHDGVMQEENRIHDTTQQEKKNTDSGESEAVPIGSEPNNILGLLPETEEKPKKRKTKLAPMVPPTQDEAIAYCKTKGYIINPLNFIEYYTNLGWKKKNGDPVLNWKNTMMNWNSGAIERGDKPWTPPRPQGEVKQFDISQELTSESQREVAAQEWEIKRQKMLAGSKKEGETNV